MLIGKQCFSWNIRQHSVLLCEKNPTFVFSNFYFVFPVQVKSRVVDVIFTDPNIMQIAILEQSYPFWLLEEWGDRDPHFWKVALSYWITSNPCVTLWGTCYLLSGEKMGYTTQTCQNFPRKERIQLSYPSFFLSYRLPAKVVTDNRHVQHDFCTRDWDSLSF